MRRYMYSLVAGLCLAACSETFPGVEGEVPEEKDFNSSEVTNDRIPILLSYNDPNYLILTRGSGPFEDFASDREHWLGAEFSVFAYKLPNSVDASYDFSSGKDYQDYLENPSSISEKDKDACLLFDKKVKLKTASESSLSGDDYLSLEWTDKGQYFFNGDRQDYKYGFFLTYCDDAIGGNNWKTSLECVYADVTIDGTQDILTAVAKPSESKMEELKGEKYKDLLANWDDLVFSTFAAHRGLQPQFKVKHETVRLAFSIKAGDERANRVTLKDVRLIRPVKTARLVAAAADENRVGVDLSNLTQGDYDEMWHLHDREDIGTEPPFLKPIVMEYDEKLGKNQVETPVGTSFLAFPANSYEIELECENRLEGDNGEDIIKVTHPKYIISLKSGEEFVAGSKYSICITVYGVQRIEMSMGTSGWVEAATGPIEIDPDASGDEGEYDIVDNTGK